MIKIKNTESKITPKKRNITLEDILVSKIKLIDADGIDLTQEFINALPDGVSMVTLKAQFELSDEDEIEDDEE